MSTRMNETQLLTMVGILLGCCMARPALGTESAAAPVTKYRHVPLCARDLGPGKRYCKAWLRVDENGEPMTTAAGATPSGLGATDLAKAYNLDTTLSSGATIGIVDAYGYPTAEADLAKYRSQYNLPPCTVASGCLKIVNQMGQTSPLPKANTGWEGETALDLDMASAACPSCKIVLVQANDESNDNLNSGEAVAAMLGATVISNSWGGPEDPKEPGSSQEHYFNIPGVTIFVASGDSGYDNGGSGADYPSTSAYVIGVGGTTLTQDSSARGWTETVWNSGGSSCGTTIPTPAFQKGMMTDCTMRAAADVAAVGDPQTGLAVYQGRWEVVGGTSAASPLVAGIFALTGKGGVGPDWVYSHKTIWNDVTSGNNDQGGSGANACPNNGQSILCNAAAGWDGPTGWGTPDGAKMKGASGGGSPPDMATPPDMTQLPDLAQPIVLDMAQPASGGGGSGGSGGGVGGNGPNGGNNFNGGNKGCGCSVGGAPSRDTGTLLLAGAVFAVVFFASRRRRRS